MKALRISHGLIGAVCLGALLATFSLYARPELMMKLANHLWACF